jgi:murein DD-endopeptidase MepM/ murein hydrolase activator NlpD
MNRSSDHLQNLADAASEDVVAASPEMLAAEVAQERSDGDAFALDFDRIVGRAERQARWRRLAQRLRALASALAWRPSWRPVLATVAGLAVVVVAGDLLFYARLGRPVIPLASTSVEPPRPPRADKAAERLAFGDERGTEEKHLASAPTAPAPPPAPALDAATAPKRIRTVTIYGGMDAPTPAPQPAARPATAAVDAPPPAAVQAQGSRAASFDTHIAAVPQQRPSALAAAPAQAPMPEAADQLLANRDVPSFAWPLRGQVIADVAAAKTAAPDPGIDIAVPVGTPIHAAADGVVVYTGNELKSYGNLVLLRHSGGFVTAYAHADEILVKVNDMVRRGQVIARSGRTGTVTVPLLHFEIRKGSTPVDPAQYLPR